MPGQKLWGRTLFAFKICYLVYLLLAFNAFVNGTAILNIAAYALTAWGSVLIIVMAVKYKTYLKVTNLWILLAFIISYGVSAVLTIQYGVTENIKGIIWLAFPLLLLYASAEGYTVKSIKREAQALAVIYVAYVAVASAVSLSMVYWGRRLKFQDQSGAVHVVGFWWGRLWGIYDDPNHGATISVIAVVLAGCLFLRIRKVWVRILLFAAILLSYTYIIFSDSRTGLVSVAAAVLIGIIFGLWRKVRLQRTWMTVAVVLCVALLGAAASVGISEATKKVYNQLDKKIEKMIAEKNIRTEKPKVLIGRKKDITKDTSNGRFAIWENGLQIAKENPIFGVSYRNMSPYAKEHMPDAYMVKNASGVQYDSMHNLVLDILVSQGALGIALFLLFAVSIFVFLLKHVRNVSEENHLLAGGAFTVVTVVATGSIFLSVLFYVNTPQGYCFWLFLGYLTVLMKKGEIE